MKIEYCLLRRVAGLLSYTYLCTNSINLSIHNHKKTKKHEIMVFTMYKGWDEEKDKAGKNAPKGLGRAQR